MTSYPPYWIFHICISQSDSFYPIFFKFIVKVLLGHRVLALKKVAYIVCIFLQNGGQRYEKKIKMAAKMVILSYLNWVRK